MNHSASFWAAGSLMAFAASVASPVLARRDSSITFFTIAASPVSFGASFSADFSSSRAFLWRFRECSACFAFLSFFAFSSFFGASLRSWRAASAFFSCRVSLWRAAKASLEIPARAARTNRQGNGRNSWIIPCSPSEPPDEPEESPGPVWLELYTRYHSGMSQLSHVRNRLCKSQAALGIILEELSPNGGSGAVSLRDSYASRRRGVA